MGRCSGGGGGGDTEQAVEEEANDGSTTPSKATLEKTSGERRVAEDIGVAYKLVGISSSFIDIIGVRDCIES
jgi:hypothetical protein